jgi:hypothetical protein
MSTVAATRMARAPALVGKAALGCALITTLAACTSSGPAAELDALIPHGARDVKHEMLGSAAVTRTRFEVDLEYPKRAVDDDRERWLRKRGWRECAQDKGNWEYFGDATAKPAWLVHRYSLTYARGAEFIVIGMEYRSALPTAFSANPRPDNHRQRVTIVRYDLTVKGMREEVRRVAGSCLSE